MTRATFIKKFHYTNLEARCQKPDAGTHWKTGNYRNECASVYLLKMVLFSSSCFSRFIIPFLIGNDAFFLKCLFFNAL